MKYTYIHKMSPTKYVSVFVVYQSNQMNSRLRVNNSKLQVDKGIKTREYLIPTSMTSLLYTVEEETPPVLTADDYPKFESLLNQMDLDETILKNHDTDMGGAYDRGIRVDRDNIFVVRI